MTRPKLILPLHDEIFLDNFPERHVLRSAA